MPSKGFSIPSQNSRHYQGVTKVARIILKRFTNAGAWEDYWQKRMQIIGNVVIGVGNYKCVSQNLGQ